MVADDPVPITEAIVRGAELMTADQNQRPFDKVVVMAQMPHTEAEVLSERVSTLLGLDAVEGRRYRVDAVISEAEAGYGTPHVDLKYAASAGGNHSAPVVGPIPSYNPQTGDYPGRVSRLSLASASDQSYSLTNDPDSIFAPDPVKGANPTTIEMLSQLMAQLQNAPAPQPIVGSDQARKAEFQLLNDLEKAAHPNADVWSCCKAAMWNWTQWGLGTPTIAFAPMRRTIPNSANCASHLTGFSGRATTSSMSL